MKRSSARSRLRIVLTAIFAVGFVWSLFMTFSSFAAANLFKIQDAKLSDLSANVSGAISSFDESTIVSNVTFHKLNDSAKYTITLKNTDSKDHIIESISDDNENAHIGYLYDSYANTLVKAGDSFDFVVTAKYTNAVTDMNARAQVTNVKFMIKYLDIAEPEAISVNPSTGDEIVKNVIILAISATGLIICIAIALKRNKKLNKIAAIAIAAVAAATIATSVKAATVEINSFTLTTNYGFYDKVVITYTDKNGDEQELISDYNEPANIPDQNKDGYDLTGWEDEQGNPVDPTQPITEDIKIHPIYRAHTYTIRFNGNGATSGEMTDLAMTFDEAKTLPANAFNFPGRTYTGWDTEANGSGAHYGDQAEAKNLTTEDGAIVTLYAQWSINPFHIDYDGNGATSGEMATTNCEYDQPCQLRENAFEKTGYHFVGWKYNNTTYANKADVTNIIENGTITMVAQWEVNHYTIAFDGNGATSGSTASMAMAYNEEKNLTANGFKKTGYTLASWKLGDNEYTDGQTVKNLAAEDGATITLKAQWTPIHYNIAFHQNADNVSGNMSSMTVAYDESTPLIENTFALEHYKFMGWNTKADGTGTPYEDEVSVLNLTTEDGATIDLYAQWKERTAMLQTGPNVKSALSNLNNTATTFKRYDGASAPDLDSVSDKVDIALPTSSFPVWAWSEDGNIYWWSEAEAPKFNPASNNFFNGLSFTSIDVSGLDASSATNMNGMFANLKLTSLNLSGFDSSAAKNMGSMFSGTTISSLDLSSLNTSSATTMGSMFYKAKIDSLKLYDETNPSESLFKTDNVTEMAGMFRESNIPSIDASKFNTAKVKDFSGMFMSTSATTIDVSGWNTESATDFTNTFANVKITSLDLSHFNTKKVKSMLGMFDGTVKMENLNVSGWDNESLTTVGYMFRSCGSNVTNGATINLAGFTTSKVKSMNLMFSGSGFTSLNLGSFSSAELTDMSNMFSQMGKIQSLSFGPDFTAEHVTNMNFAFAQMGRSMVNLDLSSLNVSSVTNLNGAFASSNAVTIDLTGWDFSNVESANNTFYGANYIATIYASSDFPASLGGTSFAYGQPIKGGAGTTYIGNENAYARIDDPDSGNPGYFTLKNARYIRYNGNGADNATPYGTMTSEYLKAGDSLKKNAFIRRGFKFAGWKDADNNEYADEQVMTGLTESKTPLELYAQWKESTSMLHSGLRGISDDINSLAGDDILDSFEKYDNGTPDINNLDTVIVSTNDSNFPTYIWREGDKVYWWSEADKVYMNPQSGNMFYAVQVKNVSLVGLDSSKVTNLSRMFQGGIVESVNFGSDFDTSHVTTMGQMFWRTTGITSLDLSSFSSESLLTVGEMFTGNTSLQSVTFGNSFTLSDVTSMASMFNECSSLESIDLSKVTFENVTTISNLFYGASALTNITLGQNINAEKLTDASSAFKGTSSLTSLDLSSFHAPSLADMSDMFRTTGVKNLDLSNLGATSITNIHEAFWGMANLETIDISNLKLSGSQSPAGLFYNDSKLTTIYANYNTDFSSATSSTYGSATRLRGGAGTTPTNNPSYLRIDDPDNDKPGVFTLRDSRYIRYDANEPYGETATGQTQSHYASSVAPYTQAQTNGFTIDNYRFLGWGTSPDSVVVYEPGALIDDIDASKEPYTLYAKWEQVVPPTLMQSMLNDKLKEIVAAAGATDSDVVAVKETTNPPAEQLIDDNVISSPESSYKIWAYYTEGTIWIYTEDGLTPHAPDILGNMLSGFPNLTDVSWLSKLDVSNTTDISSLFDQDTSLIDISPLANWDTSKLTSILGTFRGTAISDLSPIATKSCGDKTCWDTSNLEEISSAFQRMTNLSNLSPLATWNVSKLNDLNFAFYDTSSLTDFSGISGWRLKTTEDITMLMTFDNRNADYTVLEDWFSERTNGTEGLTMTSAFPNIGSAKLPSWAR